LFFFGEQIQGAFFEPNRMAFLPIDLLNDGVNFELVFSVFPFPFDFPVGIPGTVILPGG